MRVRLASSVAHIVLYIAASLDGYIARKDGAIDWLPMAERDGEDYGYAAFYESMDAVVAGSRTYELGLGFKDWPYPGRKLFVLTRRTLRSDRNDVEFLSDDARLIVSTIEAQGFQRLWLVGGGETVRAFQRAGLIDEYMIATLPIILGEGIPLFPPPGSEQPLELAGARQYPSGLVQARYVRATDSSPTRRTK